MNKKVLLLLAEGFETYEACVFIDVMGWNLEEGDGTTQLFTCGLRKEIKSSFNQRIIVDYLVNEVNTSEFDAIAIPGGFEVYHFYTDAYSEPFLDLIRQFRVKGKIIASICVGALPVAKSGILTGKRATVYNMESRRKALAEFGAIVVNVPIVNDDQIITSWNPSTAIDVALLLLEQLTSRQNANKIRELMGFKY